jgi:hypothetical protein
VSLGAILVDAIDARLGDTQDPVWSIVVRDDQRNLLRRPQSCKEAELVIVPLSFTPIGVECGDQDLGVLNAERIDLRTVLLADACTAKARCRIALIGIVEVSKRKGTTQRADAIVAGFLVPIIRVGIAFR